MNTDTESLAAHLADAFARATNAEARGWTWPPLLHLLAGGQPVTAEQLAAATGHTIDEVHAVLPTLPSIELDDQGRVVGYGITLRPTPHRFRVEGRALYTWCALDTLIFPAVLGKTATVESPCHTTGIPIRLTVHPDHVEPADPPTAVVSIVNPDDLSDVRSVFCIQVHFFATPEAAQPWLDNHPGASVHPVAEAFRLGQRLTSAVLANQTPAAP
jgi:alkylmercury lyase